MADQSTALTVRAARIEFRESLKRHPFQPRQVLFGSGLNIAYLYIVIIVGYCVLFVIIIFSVIFTKISMQQDPHSRGSFRLPGRCEPSMDTGYVGDQCIVDFLLFFFFFFFSLVH